MIEILGCMGGVYFPIVILDQAALRETGFDGQFILRCIGHRFQLKEMPSVCLDLTPHEELPLQYLKASGAGGNPGGEGLGEVETVTVFFATGQAKTISDIAAPLENMGSAAEADDPVRACQRRLKQAEADVLADKASRTSDPLTREILLAKSNLITLQLKQSEGHQTT